MYYSQVFHCYHDPLPYKYQILVSRERPGVCKLYVSMSDPHHSLTWMNCPPPPPAQSAKDDPFFLLIRIVFFKKINGIPFFNIQIIGLKLLGYPQKMVIIK